jgi:hypothetical protein
MCLSNTYDKNSFFIEFIIDSLMQIPKFREIRGILGDDYIKGVIIEMVNIL